MSAGPNVSFCVRLIKNDKQSISGEKIAEFEQILVAKIVPTCLRHGLCAEFSTHERAAASLTGTTKSIGTLHNWN